MVPIAFGPVARQYITVVGHSRESCSPHGSQVLAMRVWWREEEEGLGSQYQLLSHTPNSLTSFHWAPLTKGSITFKDHGLGTKHSTHGPLGTLKIQPVAICM
jgi:hypothetical protein